ncbi:Organic hydroperoxide resistance transcriptional regulator [Rhodobacteraceae bacterium THAF1]|uniref:MarR family winged helix-turn-helix transcriptional regulator n=1 Tax=Palleronia sp. THAF1 TaxID=2587842 RepID=UPI000F3BC266|nr:MarR family transcriptional regulator [Palleronia sp. THAF1]QFU08635.1 Organic hydroperoxide resistance transcriptional regulator [Palleronia sp. THAF1]VDC30767.1 Organic hydroperoxide resistance transcriptional regulator [Rhodobacteraceae bacterium THAF1]
MDGTKHNTCLTPEDMLCFDVYALNQAFNRVYKPLLDPLGLTYPQYLVMTVLWDVSPVSVGQIGSRLGLATSTLTPVLKRLEGQGLIHRRRSAEDERRVDISLTGEGRALAERATNVSACVLDATGMSLDDVNRLRGDLATLRDAMNASV